MNISALNGQIKTPRFSGLPAPRCVINLEQLCNTKKLRSIMAGDWIKMRVDLADDPAVIGMASSLKIDEYEVIGRLHKIWSWADKHTTDGFVPHINGKWIDKHLEKSGFSSHMACFRQYRCHVSKLQSSQRKERKVTRRKHRTRTFVTEK